MAVLLVSLVKYPPNKLCCTPQGEGEKKVGLTRLWQRDNSNKNLDEHITVESMGRGTIAGACLEECCHVNTTREYDP